MLTSTAGGIRFITSYLEGVPLKIFPPSGPFGNTQYLESGNEMTAKALPLALKVASALVFAESATMLAGAGYFAYGIITDQARSLGTLLALAVFTTALSYWLGYIALSLTKAKKFARTAAVFWQLCQLSVAFGSFSGQFANAAVGVAILVPSVAVIVLLFQKNVSALLQRDV